MRSKHFQEQTEERSIAQNMRKHRDIVFHPRMHAKGQVFGNLEEGSVIRRLDRTKKECKQPVYKQAKHTQQDTGRCCAAAVDPITEFFLDTAAEPYRSKQKTRGKESKKIGLV